MKLLFVCTANKLRSPTAEDIFSTVEGLKVSSAGLDPDASKTLTAEMVVNADIIFVMEAAQREKVRKKFKKALGDTSVVTLYIPDEYERGDPELVELLKSRVSARLPEFF